MRSIGVLVSGGGTNLQKIIDECESGFIPAKVGCVISSREDAYALSRARKSGIATYAIRRKSYGSALEYETAMVACLQKHGVSLVLLAGFMTILGETFLSAFPMRILNVHPSLLPAFSGLYGLGVHKAALETGVKITGATVHYVTPELDAGPIIAQKAVEVLDDDTPESLQKRVMEQAEWLIYPEAVKKIIESLDQERDFV